MTDKTLTPKLIGGTFTLSRQVAVPYPWHVRLWCWLTRKPAFKVVTIQSPPLPFDATVEQTQAAIDELYGRGNVKINR
jgi:hypothetical protein